INSSNELVNSIDFSADVYIEDDQSVTAIELKSVKPNSGEMRGEKQKILEGKAALYRMFPDKKINFFVGFPFDPTSNTPTDFDKKRFLGSIINMTKFFDPKETLIAKELWDYLSGDANTMDQLIEIINKISTPEFMEKFSFINNSENRDNKRYITILNEWFLFSEVELANNNLKIKESIQNNQGLQRIYNQQIFKKEDYNWERASVLKELL
ncbi:MAG: TdeIII family type II restriction endonuclease, partial [Patescibacteria group bacterium]